MGTPVSFAKGVLEEIVAHAAGSREEVCGLLFGTADRIDAARACRNVAADPLTSFEIDPVQLLAAHKAARAGGPRVMGCYHSHPTGDATPSLRDAAAAEPNGWVWVIVGGKKARPFRAVTDGVIHHRFVPLVIPALSRDPASVEVDGGPRRSAREPCSKPA